jgi:hypothetical protein
MPKQIGLFIAKCLTFSLIFFASSLLFFRPVNNYLNERAASQDASQSQENDTDALMKKYWEQIKVSEDHQAQLSRILEKQDELLLRWEKIIEKWEKH